MTTSDDEQARREQKALEQIDLALRAALAASPDDETIENARRGLVELGSLIRERREASPATTPKHPHLVDHQVRGAEVASAKLTDDDVRAIRADERTRAEIAAEYGISTLVPHFSGAISSPTGFAAERVGQASVVGVR